MTPDAGSNPDAGAFFWILLYRSPRIWYNGRKKEPGVVEGEEQKWTIAWEI